MNAWSGNAGGADLPVRLLLANASEAAVTKTRVARAPLFVRIGGRWFRRRAAAGGAGCPVTGSCRCPALPAGGGGPAVAGGAAVLGISAPLACAGLAVVVLARAAG